MKISLSTFESAIDPLIVNRGEQYFLNEAVRGLKKLNDGEWVASVHGTDIYKVRISLKDKGVNDYSCSCPYDMGPVCKHVVAALFAIRGDSGKSLENPDKQNRNSGKLLKSADETFEQIVSNMPRTDINAIIIDYAVQEPGIVDYISARRTIKAPSSSKEEYRLIIRNAIEAARDRDGFVGYWQASRAVNGAEMVLDKAREFLEKKQPARALPILQCVLEEMVPFIQEADDSNGSIGDVIGCALEGLSECAQQTEEVGFRNELFDYLLKECGHTRYEEWSDWRWELLTIAGKVVQTLQEREKLFNRIDDIEINHSNKGDWSRFDHERASVIKLSVIERLGSKEDAELFLNQHLDCTDLREIAIERTFKSKNYLAAKKLAFDGLLQDEKRGLRGLVIKWEKHLLDISEAQKDIAEIKKYALNLFLNDNDFIFYERYKKCYTNTEWHKEVQNIIGSIIDSKDGHNYALLLPQIYIREKRWPDLMAYVQKDGGPGALEEYTKYLLPHFQDELAKVYEKVIIENLAPQLGRGNYQYLCRFLRRFQKLCNQDRTKQLVANLQKNIVTARP